MSGPATLPSNDKPLKASGSTLVLALLFVACAGWLVFAIASSDYRSARLGALFNGEVTLASISLGYWLLAAACAASGAALFMRWRRNRRVS